MRSGEGGGFAPSPSLCGQHRSLPLPLISHSPANNPPSLSWRRPIRAFFSLNRHDGRGAFPLDSPPLESRRANVPSPPLSFSPRQQLGEGVVTGGVQPHLGNQNRRAVHLHWRWRERERERERGQGQPRPLLTAPDRSTQTPPGPLLNPPPPSPFHLCWIWAAAAVAELPHWQQRVTQARILQGGHHRPAAGFFHF